MAHIGSFVPAASAKISIVREIFTRIQTVESVSTRLSAFMIDLRQVLTKIMFSKIVLENVKYIVMKNLLVVLEVFSFAYKKIIFVRWHLPFKDRQAIRCL
jgi:MutS domain V